MEKYEWWLNPNKIILSEDQVLQPNQRPVCVCVCVYVHSMGASKPKAQAAGRSRKNICHSAAREPLMEIRTTSLNSGINKKEGNIDVNSRQGLQRQESFSVTNCASPPITPMFFP